MYRNGTPTPTQLDATRSGAVPAKQEGPPLGDFASIRFATVLARPGCNVLFLVVGYCLGGSCTSGSGSHRPCPRPWWSELKPRSKSSHRHCSTVQYCFAFFFEHSTTVWCTARFPIPSFSSKSRDYARDRRCEAKILSRVGHSAVCFLSPISRQRGRRTDNNTQTRRAQQQGLTKQKQRAAGERLTTDLLLQ